MRQKRHRLRSASGEICGGRVKQCGRCRITENVSVYRSARGAHYHGVMTCGSVWLCPVCASKVMEARRLEVGAAINEVEARDGAAYMATFTMPHAPFDACKALRDTIALAWSNMTRGRPWKRAKADFGVSGYIRALEVTHGENGWHPHLHVLLLADAPISDDEQEELRLCLFEIWDRRIQALGVRPCSPDACDLRRAKAADYLTKWGSDHELARHDLKRGKGGRTPWQILEDYAAVKFPRDKRLFREYAKAFKGARHLTWSRGLKADLGILDQNDENIAEWADETVQEDLPLDDGLHEGRIGVIPGHYWDAAVKLKLTSKILDAAHKEGWAGVVRVMKEAGLWLWGPPVDPPGQPPRTRAPGGRHAPHVSPSFWKRLKEAADVPRRV